MLLKLRKNATIVLTIVCAFVFCVSAALAATAYKPSAGSTVSSASEFKLSSPFAQHFVIDKPVIYFPVTSSLNVSTTDTLTSMGTGTAVPTEVNSSEVGGMLFDADNESHSFLIPIPIDIDLAQEIKFRAIWSNSTTSVTGSARFYFLYKQLTLDTTAVAVAASTMSTDGAADPDSATAYALQGSPWSTLNGSSLTGTPGDDFLVVKCYVDITTITDAYLLGIQIQYSRKFLGGDNL